MTAGKNENMWQKFVNKKDECEKTKKKWKKKLNANEK